MDQLNGIHIKNHKRNYFFQPNMKFNDHNNTNIKLLKSSCILGPTFYLINKQVIIFIVLYTYADKYLPNTVVINAIENNFEIIVELFATCAKKRFVKLIAIRTFFHG